MNQLSNNTSKIALLAVLTATSIATNYLMIGAINIKLMDLIVFTSGYLLGSGLGALTGVLVWLVYGTINPFGFSLPIFLSTMVGESLFGFAGGLFRMKSSNEKEGFDIWIGFTGFFLTFIYDLLTNIVSGLTAGIPISIALVTGVPFFLAHTLSNTFFFGFGFKPLISQIKKVMKGNE